MVVDDTPQNLSLMTELLRDQYRLMVANSGERALKLLQGEQLPDLIRRNGTARVIRGASRAMPSRCRHV
jgi:response regulator RpfG family c-di-GMP phosphodiesterase